MVKHLGSPALNILKGTTNGIFDIEQACLREIAEFAKAKYC